jgi:DnaJ-domain-containing protein 1
LKNYYSILRLPNYARGAEIKQAYRHLALLYHPDKNKSIEAPAYFIEINEAYEVLGDPFQKVVYDQMLNEVEPQASTDPVVTRPHRDPRYRPKSAEYIKEARAKKKPYVEFMNGHVQQAVLFSRLALLFSITLLADYSLQPNKHSQTIKAVEKKLGNESVKVEINDGEAFTLGGQSLQEFATGEVINLYLSPLFSIPTRIENEQTKFQAGVPITIYGNFIFAPFFLVITSLIGTFYWKSVEFRFNLGVMNFLLMLLNFIFLNIHSF